MTELHACYFCGTPGDLSQVAVIPPRFDLDEDEQRTVHLCPTCRQKLADVLEPLAPHLDAARETGAQDAGEMESPEAGETKAQVGREPEPGDPSDSSGGLGDIMGENRTLSPEPDEDSTPSASDGSDGDGDSGASERSPGAGASADGPPPEGYRRVMRLLENRELPVSRDEISVVATNAYDLPPERFDRILEAAVARGRLVIEDGELRRP